MAGVFLVDDHEVVRRGLRDLLEADGDLRVVGEAGSATEALVRLPTAAPDVTVIDVRLPDGDGVSLCREIRLRHPGVTCLMLTSYADPEVASAASRAGAAGYLLKQIKGNDLVDAVRRCATGEHLGPSGQAVEIDRTTDPLEHLTEQERRVFELLGEGMTNRQIAEAMYLAEKTVKNYVSNLLAKLGMHRRTEAAAEAARLAERRRVEGAGT